TCLVLLTCNDFWLTRDGPQGTSPVCNEGLYSRVLNSIFAAWEERAQSEPLETIYGAFNSNAPTMLMAYQVTGTECQANPAGLSDRGRGVVSVTENDRAAKPYFTFVHELGHVLGMDDGPEPCTNSLMCTSGGNESPHIPGCELRDGQSLAVLPFNCQPVPGETVPGVASCARARQYAASLSRAAQQPVAFEPGTAGAPGWTRGGALVGFNSLNFTEGNASLQVDGGGWSLLSSLAFRTADWLAVGTRLAFDVYVDANQPNPQWVGALDVQVDIPAAGVNSADLGHVELTPLDRDQWNSVEVDVPLQVASALLGDYPGGVLHVAANLPSGAPPLLLDNLRFSGELTGRTVFHADPQEGGTTSPLLNFESLDDWSGDLDVMTQETEFRTQGTAALGIEGSGYALVQSRPFVAAEEIGSATDQLSVDVLIPSAQPDPHWLGALQLYVTCPAHELFDAHQGQVELTPLFVDEFNTVTFTLSEPAVEALNDEAAWCSLGLALNANSGSGRYVLDNLAFR
ncbi:hypothetical protein ACFL5O_06185, partial [Myxococcota bacterium]